jgi:hypothetical protein
MTCNHSNTMKKAAILAFATLATLSSPAFAGEKVVTSYKNYKTPIPEACFREHELQLDIFGQYTDGNSPVHAGPIRDHGWGGGIGLNYFFTLNLGVGVEAAWLNARENASLGDGGYTAIHNYSASLIYRFPIQEKCLAPYVFLGGGVAGDGENWAFGHAGLGIEYRIKPQKLGVFLDGRWTYYGDRFGHGDQNNASARVGLRIIF